MGIRGKQSKTNQRSRIANSIIGRGEAHIHIETCSLQWTIPELDKLLNSKTILAQLERAF